MKFQTKRQKKNLAVVLILLSAIFSGAVSLAFYSPNQFQTAEMVYCPLTKRLQPVHAADLKQNEFDGICLTDKQKSDFSSAILTKISFGFSFSNKQSVEEIVFDYLNNGKSALDALPNLPNLPEKTLAKKSFSLIGFGNNFEHQVILKSEENFSFKLKARPPTKTVSVRFEYDSLKDLATISRNINPRSPPVLSI
ncbi:MAG TPA: hypothetical protein PKY59_00645 [Pyrinomonadaceae bacterium]|nr:hypothetical protein [Pyrinomonadaceae bacterium]